MAEQSAVRWVAQKAARTAAPSAHWTAVLRVAKTVDHLVDCSDQRMVVHWAKKMVEQKVVTLVSMTAERMATYSAENLAVHSDASWAVHLAD